MADRRMWTLKQKKEHVLDFRTSGRLMRDYCAQKDAPSVSCMSRWCRQMGEDGRWRPRRRMEPTRVPAAGTPPLSASAAAVDALRQEVAMLRQMLASAWRNESDRA